MKAILRVLLAARSSLIVFCVLALSSCGSAFAQNASNGLSKDKLVALKSAGAQRYCSYSTD